MLAVVFICLCVCLVDALRGVASDMERQFEGRDFLCEREGKTVRIEAVNDDFCDCPLYGEDEPGTSACAMGSFYCENKGFMPKNLPSSNVDDGLCDCCDGSDESPGLCVNTCKLEALEVQREWMNAIQVLKKGIQAKAGLMEESTDRMANHEKEVEALKVQLKKHEDEVEKLKSKETELSELKRLGEEARNLVQGEEIQEGEEKEEEEPDESFPYPEEYRFDNEEDKGDEDFPYPEEYKFDAEEGDEPIPFPEEHKVDSAEEETSGFIHKTIEGVFEWFKSSNDENDAISMDKLKSDLESIQKKLRTAEFTVNDKKNEIEKKMKYGTIDFGAHNEFESLFGLCFEIQKQSYTFEMCPFGKSYQKDGKNSIHLGTFQKWGDQPYKEMLFEHGQKCWNGPQRTTKVQLKCGTSNKITHVDEPSICSYEMVFESPSACDEVDLELLEAKVAKMFLH